MSNFNRNYSKPTKQTTQGVTSAWYHNDTYCAEVQTSRWILFKALVRGVMSICWQVPYNKKRKGLYIKGKKL